jgi:hypothetical protein
MYTYVSEQTGKKHPTFMSFGHETETGKNATRIFAISAQGAGFDVVAQSSNMPLQVSATCRRQRSAATTARKRRGLLLLAVIAVWTCSGPEVQGLLHGLYTAPGGNRSTAAT